MVWKASKSFLTHIHARENFYLSMKLNIYLSNKPRLVKSIAIDRILQVSSTKLL